MRVYVETNFILELVLEQSEHQACESLLNLASERKIELVLPSFSLFETLYTIDGKIKPWKHASYSEFKNTLRETSRTHGLAARANDALRILSELEAGITNEVEQRWNRIENQLLGCSEQLPLNREILLAGKRFQAVHNLSMPDALVLASVLGDPRLGESPSWFLNRNSTEFGVAGIIELLRAKSCELKGSFTGGHHLILAALNES